MDGRELPGFYFDPEKKKYFKIQDQHVVHNAGAKYTKQNIKKEKRKASEMKKNAQKSNQIRQQTVTRRAAGDSLMHSGLARELGLKSRLHHMKAVWPDACASLLPDIPHIPTTHPTYSSTCELFTTTPDSKAVFAVLGGHNKIKRYWDGFHDGDTDFSGEDDRDESYEFQPMQSSRGWKEIASLTSWISTLTYMPTTGALAATTLGSDRPPVIYLTDPFDDPPYISRQITPMGMNSIRAAAARPNWMVSQSEAVPAAESEVLAVAGSRTLGLVTRQATGDWDYQTVFKTPSDILTLDWLSETVLALAQRDGKIKLYDMRSGRSSHILTHRAAPVQIRRADNMTRMVVSGLHNTLMLYDIRFCRPSSSFDNEFSYGDSENYERAESEEQSRRGKRQKIHKLPKSVADWYVYSRRNSTALYLLKKV